MQNCDWLAGIGRPSLAAGMSRTAAAGCIIILAAAGVTSMVALDSRRAGASTASSSRAVRSSSTASRSPEGRMAIGATVGLTSPGISSPSTGLLRLPSRNQAAPNAPFDIATMMIRTRK